MAISRKVENADARRGGAPADEIAVLAYYTKGIDYLILETAAWIAALAGRNCCLPTIFQMCRRSMACAKRLSDQT